MTRSFFHASVLARLGLSSRNLQSLPMLAILGGFFRVFPVDFKAHSVDAYIPFKVTACVSDITF